MPQKDDEQKPPSYYINEEGLLTFTEYFLRRRGYCCGNGCRHCPYDYEAVPEPRRTELLNKRKENGSESQ